MKNIIKLVVLVLLFTACDDLFEPALENNRGLEAMYNEPTYAQGILANAYILLPYSSTPNSDVATDDAVSNDNGNNYLAMATGSWTANNNPLSQWQSRRNAIQYLNLFLANTDEVVWSKDEVINTMYNDRLKGEAYALRAVQMYSLLLAHGGWSESGQLLGFPIVTEPETASFDFNLPRNTFQQCVDQIISDANQALELLPPDDPQAILMTGNLAVHASRQGRHAEAEKIYRDVLDIEQRVLGPTHQPGIGTAPVPHRHR